MQTESIPQHSAGASVHLYEIHINRQLYKVAEPLLAGAQLKALGAIPAENQLFLEQQGGKDLPIGDQQSVEMKNGLHFYDVAPGNFGDER